MQSLLRPTAFKRTMFFAASDILLSLLTLYLAYALRFNFAIPSMFLESFWFVFVVIAGLKLLLFYVYKLYFSVWRFFSFYEAKSLVKVHVISYVLFIVIFFALNGLFDPFPRSVIIIDFFLSLIFLGGLRASKRIFSENQGNQSVKPALIIGTGSKAATIIQSALKGEIDYYPHAIISLADNEMTKNAYINNIKIYEEKMMEEIVKNNEINTAIITNQLTAKKLHTLVKRLNSIGIDEIKQVKMLGSEHDKLEDLSIEDLLARHPKDLDTKIISEFIKGSSVLITGAGGSIGSEIARQCHSFGASSLTLVDNSEYNLYQIGEQIGNANLRLVNITEKEALEKVIESAKPDIVIHAAAYKHVPLCEENQQSAVHNNIQGSKNIIDLSIEHGVEKVVIVSTDKAVRPTNVMGATKRVVELYATNIESGQTDIVSVRFGNVLGSSGSVIPKFKNQIEEGGPVTVTHPDINRYFMLISEACQLVLQAAAIAKGKELFVLDMGEPIKIMDLAKQMIHLYGKKGEVEINIIGLRAGEKLYEELLLDEGDKQTIYSSIFIATPSQYEIEQLKHDIVLLLESENKVEALQKIVPEFTHEVMV
ncbi:MAG: polysaccharide biosynthesis protein [Sulfurovum sp.]|nr:polysaccharide biosynthesis protein [Sulfurovum sp.]